MNDEDQDLKLLLSPLSKIAPTPLQIRRWQKRAVRPSTLGRSKIWMALAAGILMGFLSATLMGKLSSHASHSSESDGENNFQANATFEWVSIKTE